MEKIVVKTLVNTQEAFLFLGLSVFTIVLPFFIHVQWLTGPLVNMALILALFLLGIRSALILALLPSVIALSSGLLPAPLAPAVPFIMISNAILVLSVDFIYSRFKNANFGYILGALSGAVLKSAFLFASVQLIANLLIKKELAVKVSQMMGISQLITAIAGASLAYIVLKNLKKV